MRTLGPSARFPVVAMQSLPITSGEGGSRSFISTSPPTSPGLKGRPMRDSVHYKAAEISMEEG